MKLFTNSFNNRTWKDLCQKLVLENCLIFGLNSRLTSKKINKYLLGTRDTLEIFKLYELRYLLLKIYPLVHILFQNPRVNSKFELKPSKTELLQPKSFSFQKNKFIKKRVSFSFKHKNLPPQILFATTTEAFSDIVFKAATICNMPCHKKRWINGSITAAIFDIYNNDLWHYSQNLADQQISSSFNNYWSLNKENNEKIKEKTTYYGRSRWPSLIVIPDIANNSMILSEVQKIGIPVIGLVNSHCRFEIDYPIFAQDQNFSSVYFFCHFLSILIAKEMAYSQHKHYTLQNIQPQIKKKINLLAQEQKKTFSPKKTLFQKLVGQQKIKKYLKKDFFFKNIVPIQQKISQRHPGSTLWYTFRCRMYAFSWFRDRKQMHKILGLKPYFFSFPRGFWNIIHYFDKRHRLNSFWRGKFKTLSAFHTRHFEKRKLIPGGLIFKHESKKKYYLKHMRNLLLWRERKYLTNHLLRNFLWLSKKMPLYWKYQLLESTKTLFANNSYFWWSLQNLISDFRWQQHEHILPKFLNIKKKLSPPQKMFQKNYKKSKVNFVKPQKNYKKWKANFVKPQKKQTWKKWAHKSKKYQPLKKNHTLLPKPKKTPFRY